MLLFLLMWYHRLYLSYIILAMEIFDHLYHQIDCFILLLWYQAVSLDLEQHLLNALNVHLHFCNHTAYCLLWEGYETRNMDHQKHLDTITIHRHFGRNAILCQKWLKFNISEIQRLSLCSVVFRFNKGLFLSYVLTFFSVFLESFLVHFIAMTVDL